MSNNQQLKSNLWSWILISAGAGLSILVLVELLLMPRLVKTPNMIEFMAGSNGSSFLVFKIILLFGVFSIIFYLLFFLQSAVFTKELNFQARSLLSLDKYVQFKEDYRFVLIGDDKKYITENADQMDSYHHLRRITLRKPLNWVEKLYFFLIILWFFYIATVFYPNSLQDYFLFVVLLYLQAGLVLFIYLFRKLNSLLHGSRKVDELIDNPQGVR
jgi:hypothetical protein